MIMKERRWEDRIGLSWFSIKYDNYLQNLRPLKWSVPQWEDQQREFLFSISVLRFNINRVIHSPWISRFYLDQLWTTTSRYQNIKSQTRTDRKSVCVLLSSPLLWSGLLGTRVRRYHTIHCISVVAGCQIAHKLLLCVPTCQAGD